MENGVDLKSIQEFLVSCPGCNSERIGLVSRAHEICECKCCGLYFNNPRPNQKYIAKNYCEGGYYKKFSPDHNWTAMWERRVKRIKKYMPSGRILDVGAGIGTPLSLLRGHGFEIAGTEISTEAIEKAKLLYGIDLMEGYVEDLGLKDEYFDAITLWAVFEHLPYPGNTLKNLNRLLKNDGYIIITVPNISFWRGAHDPHFLIASRARKLEWLIPKIEYGKKYSEIHLIHFTPRSLRRILQQNGFFVEELNIVNVSLRPYWVKDMKDGLRIFFANKFKIFTHEDLFICGRKVRPPAEEV